MVPLSENTFGKSYKRQDLLFSDLGRLRGLAQVGPLQVVYGGKAHPRDEGGKDMIRRVLRATGTLGESVRVVYLEDYDMALGKILCAGVDLWLNTPCGPRKPREPAA
jgi:starch phosphorylase